MLQVVQLAVCEELDSVTFALLCKVGVTVDIRVKITLARATFAQKPWYQNFSTVLNVCVLDPHYTQDS